MIRSLFTSRSFVSLAVLAVVALTANVASA